MKRLMPVMIGSAAICALLSTGAWAEDLLPGEVDFGSFSPPKNGGEFVEVNVPSALISLAARMVEKEEPDVAKLLGGLKLVRVNVIGVDSENQPELQKRAEKVRKELAAKGWQRIVTAREQGQEAAVYLKMSDSGAVQGLAAVVMDGSEHAVFVNIVGEIRPEQLSQLADKLHIDVLKNVGAAERKAGQKSQEQKPEKGEK
jgi:hypothetical protein